jgi:hypothetical protein
LFQKLEVFMPLTVVLAVCLDSTSLAIHDSDWKSAGYIVTAAGSIREATERFKAGDFDNFADATFGNEPTELLLGMGELVARSAKILAMRKVQNDLPAFKLPRSA